MNFRRTFVTGLLVITPLLVTFWVGQLIVGAIHGAITPLIFRVVGLAGPEEWRQHVLLGYLAPAISVFLAVVVIYTLGLLGGNVLGRQILKSFESVLLHIPVVRGVYSATRQFIDTFSQQDGKSFAGVALVEFPHKGIWTLGLITGETRGEVPQRLEQSLTSVFVPTTPNPTGGYLIFVPTQDLRHVDMTIDEALKMIISGGVLTPEFPRAPSE